MYRLYIDETGNADLDASGDDNHRYLSLTGIIARISHMRDDITPLVNGIKTEIFKSDPDEPIIFHRKAMVQKNYPFEALRDPDIEAEFNRRILALFRDSSYRVITAVIDKREHKSKYQVWHHEPYHYCLEVLLERYVMWLKSAGARGDVLAEARNTKPDKKLKASYARLYEHGTSYIAPKVMQKYLTTKELKLKEKRHNVTGLQLVDLLAHPSFLHARSVFTDADGPIGFGGKIVQVLLDEEKYHCNHMGVLRGYGLKWLP